MRPIETLCVEVTNRCPLRCAHCSAEASPQRGDFFPVEVFAELLGKLDALREVYVSGGEPFEHPEVEQFVRLSSRHATNTVVYSSGTQLVNRGVSPLPAERLARTAMAGLSRIDFSLYSVRADEHDAITRTSGSFTALMETVQTARSLGLPFGIHFVPLVRGGRDVRAVASMARELSAARFHVLAIAPQGRATAMTTTLDKEFLEEIGTLYTEPGLSVVLSSAIRGALDVGRTPRDSWASAFVDVHGSVHRSEGQRRFLPLVGPPRADAIANELATLN
jgi:MoaA/NifB/PqqE/SkfB family radical SAM enzyme